MSWSHSSKLGLVALSLLVLFATAGVASAVSVADEQAPEEAEVGEEVTVTVELQDLFSQESSWELNGRTELQNAQWTIELYQGGELVGTRESSGEQPDPVLLEEGVTDADRVVVTITGTAPEVGEYSYEEPATFRAGEVVQVVDGGSNVNYLSELDVHHYTTGDPGSQEARTALDDANAAIQSVADSGTDTSEAESTFDDAVSAYNGEDFANAVSLAEEAESQAQSSDDGSDGGSSDDGTSDGNTTDDGSTSTDSGDANSTDDGSTAEPSSDDGSATDSSTDGGTTEASDSGGDDDGGLLWILLYGLLGLLILGAVGGGILWYQNKQQGPSRDPLG